MDEFIVTAYVDYLLRKQAGEGEVAWTGFENFAKKLGQMWGRFRAPFKAGAEETGSELSEAAKKAKEAGIKLKVGKTPYILGGLAGLGGAYALSSLFAPPPRRRR